MQGMAMPAFAQTNVPIFRARMDPSSCRFTIHSCHVYSLKKASLRISPHQQGYNVRQRWAGTELRQTCSNGTRWRAVQWLENSAEQEVAIPVEKAFEMWEDRERIPQWMPWITSVTVLPEDPRLSRWTLSTQQFGRNWEFSWLAQNLTPTKLQKIHWRSVQGSTGGSLGSGIDIANRGQIRFYRKTPTSCSVKLTISYEVPDVLAPFAGALTPIVESILSNDLKRFAELAPRQA
ncbi:hypothetical protein COCSUDRAFT_29043 [Coccomyxa subellipsoidea C-169]|uniref:Coenzyme Q-binding protein COQ10 START domain-containing protein n=1 Tax=Coccomyxa subellipsoidea (strain C-169) TaxID=574566 RepID=I0YX56_COCSC|nr:hypothetical protein COCSUDRAFT_29043 [Coccomyxa subellipsoidea C-169]EIE22975.1 hypothetical protein COCSUDRAFT_29043 [Coccomyxa subellipsoidea C-169]|eukprot:XP_005647519.1 hypothetical protein COCSUDRAFT_29043 [Coccomyxa subellipsoidea C-169]